MLRGAITVAAAFALVACASPTGNVEPSTRPPTTTPPTSATPATATAAPTPTTSEPAARSSAERSAAQLCARNGIERAGEVANGDLVEASGLVASRHRPGVLWSHNDGGNAGVYAIGSDGRDLGFHEITGVSVVDIEDMAIGAGAIGDDLFLADIGDNDADRALVRVYRFAEPDPDIVAPIVDVDVLEFVYPDRPHNAETLLIDQSRNRVVIVTKEQAPSADGVADAFGRSEPSIVFEGDLTGHGAGPLELVAVGIIDTPMLETRAGAPTLHPATLLGFGGVPTGGDVSADGELVALRTYEAVWVWPRLPGQSIGQAFSAEPCQVATFPEAQGEAVAFDAGGLVTLSEGENQFLNQLAR
jgi:hypothetical protein